MKERTARTYDKEFKKNAVNLYLNSGRTYKEISEELGVPYNNLSGWVIRHKTDGADAFPGKGHIKASDEEMIQLRKKLAITREERDILNKRWASSPHSANEI